MTASRYPDWASFQIPATAGRGETRQPVAFCGDLSPASVLAAFARGIFPVPAATAASRALSEVRWEGEVGRGAIAIVGNGSDPYRAAWHAPDPRPVIGPGDARLGRNARRVARADGLVTTANVAFRAVAEACRAGREPRWLTDELLDTMDALHHQGWAHSIEVWDGDELAGGAIGIGAGRVISGDTLFGRRPGAAAIAVADMASRLAAAGGELIDAQWDSPFLRSLGAAPVARDRYLAVLASQAGQVALPAGPLPACRLLAPRN